MKNYYSSTEWKALKSLIDNEKGKGKELVFTNGCFDILHPGHLALLDFAKKQKGFFILGLNSDDSVRRLKGAGRPINTAKIRGQNLLDTGLIDAVVVYEEDTPQEITDILEPSVLIKGGDYHFETIVGAPEVKSRGGKVLVFPTVPGHSTTKIIESESKKIETNQL